MMGAGDSDQPSYSPPEWLDEEFLQDVLREYFKDDSIRVCGLKVEPMASAGYASEMHRASFQLSRDGELVNFSVIIKDHPKGFVGVVAHKRQLFQREILTYKEILPRVEELLHSIGDLNTRISPVCYYTTETPEPFLILEDMKIQGYENFSHGQLLNLEQVLPVIHKLAKLHACSVILVAKNPNLMEYFQDPPIFKHRSQSYQNQNQNGMHEREEFMEFYPVNMHCVASVVSQWKGYEEIAQKLHQLADKMTISSMDMLHRNQGKGFRVFNVADLWIRNLLFQQTAAIKEEEEEETTASSTDEYNDVVIIDYQLAYYGSPAMDLNYLLFGSVNENVRKMHLRYIVKEYHRVLRDSLEKFNYDHEIPTLKDITIEMIQYSLQGVIAATCLTPIVFMENNNNRKYLGKLTSSSAEGDALRLANANHPRYRTFLQRTLKEFDLCGFLDS